MAAKTPDTSENDGISVQIRLVSENDFIGREDDSPNPKFIPIETGDATVWNMEFITPESVVFSYELGNRGFHWHCENDDIQLQLHTHSIWKADSTNQFQIPRFGPPTTNEYRIKHNQQFVQYNESGSIINLSLVYSNSKPRLVYIIHPTSIP